jgi:hypothetical protein
LVPLAAADEASTAGSGEKNDAMISDTVTSAAPASTPADSRVMVIFGASPGRRSRQGACNVG